MPQFEEAVEDWQSYQERLEQFIIANSIGEDKKVATLLTLVGPKAYKLLKNLVAPAKPSEKSYEDLTKVLTGHFSPKKNIIRERFIFNRRDQGPDESINQYLAVLKQLASTCEYKDHLEDQLRDRLVCGIRSEGIQKRLLAEDKITLAKAVEICLSMESASIASSELNKCAYAKSTKTSVDTVRQVPPGRQWQKASYQYCKRCGGPHDQEICRFKDAVCRQCGEKGHIQRKCLNKYKGNYHYQKPSKPDDKKTKKKPFGKPKRYKAHEVHAEQHECESSDDSDVLCHLQDKKKSTRSEPIMVVVRLQGKKVQMEVDTGSAVSILPYRLYVEHFQNLELNKSETVFQSYFGENKQSKGRTKVKVQYGNQMYELDIHVVETEGPALFGREWLRVIPLEWQKIMKIGQLPNEGNTKEKLKNLLQKYDDLFKDELGLLKNIKGTFTIQADSKPKLLKCRTEPYALKPRIHNELKKLVDQGVISPVSTSDWATPLVPVVKPDGSVRLCGDFRMTLNPVLEDVNYPLPRIEDTFANLAGGNKFSKIDLASAYLQMELDDNSKKYTTITTSQGLFQYNRLPFGVKTAPALWQRAIEQVLAGLVGVQVYLDDILVTGRTDAEHLANLEKVLERLSNYGLRIKPKKCEWFQDQISYLGHCIDSQGLHTAPKKVEAIVNAPAPTDKTQLQSFLGLLNYYGRFIPNLSTVVAPLNRLRNKSVKFVWTKECSEAFEKAKTLVTSSSVLIHYDPELPLKLDCDASQYGIGAVISHVLPDGGERPIAFSSRTLTKAEKNYSQIDREALSLVYGVKKFHSYLYGPKFVLVTDH